MLIFLFIGCSTQQKSKAIIKIIEESATRYNAFKRDRVAKRKAFESFEGGSYRDAVQVAIAMYENKQKCEGCLKSYIESLRYYAQSAGEFHIEQFSYFLNNHTSEVDDTCRALKSVDKEAVFKFINTSYDMNYLKVKKSQLSSCLL